jgi:hypothetical protein
MPAVTDGVTNTLTLTAAVFCDKHPNGLVPATVYVAVFTGLMVMGLNGEIFHV